MRERVIVCVEDGLGGCVIGKNRVGGVQVRVHKWKLVLNGGRIERVVRPDKRGFASIGRVPWSRTLRINVHG